MALQVLTCHLDRFCRFCTTHQCDQTDRQTDRQTTLLRL